MADDVFRFFHTSLAHEVAGQLARTRLDDVIAIGTELLQILLGGRMGKHVEVHGRCDEYGRLGRQIRCDEHVVGNAIGHLADGGGRSGSNQHGIGPKAQVHMTVPRTVALGEELADDRLAGKGRQGNGRDKLLARRRDDHLHLCPTLDEATDDVAGLVGSNATRNAQNNLLAFQYICHNRKASLIYLCANSRKRILVSMALVFNVKSLFNIQP